MGGPQGVGAKTEGPKRDGVGRWRAFGFRLGLRLGLGFGLGFGLGVGAGVVTYRHCSGARKRASFAAEPWEEICAWSCTAGWEAPRGFMSSGPRMTWGEDGETVGVSIEARVRVGVRVGV